MSDFNASDWYWQVAGRSDYWSSAVAAYVEALPQGASFTAIASEAELSDVLRPYGLRGPVIASADVNAERDRRIVAGKTINGVAVTGRDEDARNLTNLALAAQLRIALAVRFLPDGSTGAALRVEIAEALMELAQRSDKGGRRWWRSDKAAA